MGKKGFPSQNYTSLDNLIPCDGNQREKFDNTEETSDI